MPRKTKGKKKGGRVISVDFKGAGKGGRRKVPDGDYLCIVSEIEEEVGQTSGQPYLNWTFEVKEPERYAGAKLWHNTSLQPQTLFNLRNVLEAMGVEVPDSIVNLNLDDYMGLELGIGVENELYQGEKKPRPIEFFTTEEYFSEDVEEDEEDEDEDDEEEEDEEEEDEEEDEDEIEYEDMSLDELVNLCEERDIDIPKKPKKKKLIALLEEYDEEEL